MGLEWKKSIFLHLIVIFWDIAVPVISILFIVLFNMCKSEQTYGEVLTNWFFLCVAGVVHKAVEVIFIHFFSSKQELHKKTTGIVFCFLSQKDLKKKAPFDKIKNFKINKKFTIPCMMKEKCYPFCFCIHIFSQKLFASKDFKLSGNVS